MRAGWSAHVRARSSHCAHLLPACLPCCVMRPPPAAHLQMRSSSASSSRPSRTPSRRHPKLVLGHLLPECSGGSAGCAASMRRLRSISAGGRPLRGGGAAAALRRGSEQHTHAFSHDYSLSLSRTIQPANGGDRKRAEPRDRGGAQRRRAQGQAGPADVGRRGPAEAREEGQGRDQGDRRRAPGAGTSFFAVVVCACACLRVVCSRARARAPPDALCITLAHQHKQTCRSRL